MTGMNSLLFLKVLCDLERRKIETFPGDDFGQDACGSSEQPGEKSFVKIYMQKKYGIGGSQGSKRYACHRCSCLFKRKRHLRLHIQFQCNHKCLGCSECYANIHKLFNSLGEENPEPVKAFTCSYCPTSFLTHAGLAIHEECHPQPGEVLGCESCSQKFNTRWEFYEHQKTHVTLVTYNCKKCAKVFSSLSSLAKHVRVKHKTDKELVGNHVLFQLNEDPGSDFKQPHDSTEEYEDEDEQGGDEHDEDKHDDEEQDEDKHDEGERDEDKHDEESDEGSEESSKVCALCNKKFKSMSLNKMHVCPEFPSIEKFREQSTFQCPACSQTYSSFVALEMHCGAHTGCDPLSCTACDKKFSSVRKANDHFEFHGRSTCNKCNVLFRTKLSFLLHHCGFTQRCFVCEKTFPTQNAFKHHLRVHPQPKNFVYKCSECKKSFAKESYFRAHQITHTGVQPFCCSICDQKFLMFGPFKKHVISHLSNHSYVCNTCGRGFTAPRTLRAHLKTHLKKLGSVESESAVQANVIKCENDHETDCTNSAKPDSRKEPPEESVLPTPTTSGYPCNVCNKVLRKQHQLFIHLRDCHGEKPPYLLHCDLCSRGFYHKLHLDLHKHHCARRNNDEREQATVKIDRTKQNSFEERKLECPQCHKKYFTQQSLDNHMYIHRDDSEYPYQCHTCGAGYVREHSLKVHLEKCKDPIAVKNSIRCKICRATFINEKRLSRHMEAHGSEWECSDCKEKFLTKKGYMFHQKKCTPEYAKYRQFRKPKKAPTVYSCPTCERTFILKDRFEAHVASHEGIKRFQCPTCFSRFMSINNFKRHKCKFGVKKDDVTVA